MSTYKKVFAWLLAHKISKYEDLIRPRKEKLFSGLSGTILEIGAGTGSNIPYFPEGIKYTALEPNQSMWPYLKDQLSKHRVLDTEILAAQGEQIPLQNESVDTVICSLVLCSVKNPKMVLSEVLRVLKKGGSFIFIEHVAAPHHTKLRTIQHLFAPLARFIGDGCNIENEAANLIRQAGFARVEFEEFKLPLQFVGPAAPHIAGIAVK